MPLSDEQTKKTSHGVLPRPPAVLQELPVEYRWEFTRRHPYYLLFWEGAHKYLQNPSDDPPQRMLGEANVLMLTLIGVTGDPPPPGASLNEVEASDLSQAWEKGAIAPVTFRALAGLMLKELPPESRATIGQFLLQSAASNDGVPREPYELYSEFFRLQDPSLEKMTIAPLVSINVNAPLRTILEAIEEQVRQWKTQLGISEHRRRDDKLAEYLRIWDAREGWVGDRYDVRQEKTLRKIAGELGMPLSTTANQYRSAFRYLTGQKYRPELWARLFGVLKTSELIDPATRPKLALRRPWKSPRKREVPETVVAPRQTAAEGHKGGFLENMAVIRNMQADAELGMDIRTLIDKGYDDARIAEALEQDLAELEDMIQYFRQRDEDGI